MSTPVRASDRDLRALGAIVSQDRADLPDGDGLPPSLLADLMGQIRCDALSLDSWDPGRQMCRFSQEIPSGNDAVAYADLDKVFWANYWDCQVCSYAARTGDLRSVVMNADIYSARQWHSTGMYTDHHGPLGVEHHLTVCLPRALPPTAGPGRHVQLALIRGTGRCSRCWARTWTGPTWRPSGAATPCPGSPPGSATCCAWWRPGTPTPRSPGGSALPREPCAPTWKTSTNGYTSPAAPPPSPAPSRTGSPSEGRPSHYS